MSLQIDSSRCDCCGICIDACPFGALESVEGRVEINAACKLCGICVKKCPQKAICLQETTVVQDDLASWRDILVFGEVIDGSLHPVFFELVGKALELARPVGQAVHGVLVGEGASAFAEDASRYGLASLLVFDDPAFRYFTAETFAPALESAIRQLRPSVVLVGATVIGRSLAPRTAARFRTGLTADCTSLELRPDGNLVQIRPAFGGNIMARIVTRYTRPQFATVRYKVMNRAQKSDTNNCRVIHCEVPAAAESGIRVLSARKKPQTENISDSEVLIAAGRGVKNQEDLNLLRKLAGQLNGQLAGTRPLIESGWLPYTHQIGLSGRTVKPRLIITCGISGAVQFTACMKDSDVIISINTDPDAPIFKVSHYGIVGNLYEIVPQLTIMLEKGVLV